MPKLAILGGPKVRSEKFPAYRVIGTEEETAARRVIESGILSRFLGSWHEDFYGGEQVRGFEADWARYYNGKNAIAVNSATSALYCAVGALGIGPGDEVIVSPYTMCASATAPLIYNAIPVFADIEEDFFCLSAESVEQAITERTRAIIVVDILGQPYDADAINAIAKKHNLFVIEDCAQAPGALYKGKPAGTLADIGVYSLNYHKHVHTGEGGIVVTNNDEIAEKVRLIRNHAEAVVGAKGISTLVNMIGFNFRMTEIEAAIGREQLKKLSGLVDQRIKNVDYLAARLKEIPCIRPAETRPNCRHVFYVHALNFDQNVAGVHRNKFVEAVKAELAPTELRETEGVKVGSGYVKPLYLEPLYQKMIAYGDKGCPWKCGFYHGNVRYDKGMCPTVEKMHFESLITHELMRPPMTKIDLDQVADAFVKVWENRAELN